MINLKSHVFQVWSQHPISQASFFQVHVIPQEGILINRFGADVGANIGVGVPVLRKLKKV